VPPPEHPRCHEDESTPFHRPDEIGIFQWFAEGNTVTCTKLFHEDRTNLGVSVHGNKKPELRNLLGEVAYGRADLSKSLSPGFPPMSGDEYKPARRRNAPQFSERWFVDS
jgi:hypothetical protein